MWSQLFSEMFARVVGTACERLLIDTLLDFASVDPLCLHYVLRRLDCIHTVSAMHRAHYVNLFKVVESFNCLSFVCV